MKKIYKIVLIIGMFISLLSTTYAYNLNIKAEYIKDTTGKEMKYIAMFRLYQKAHPNSVSAYNKNKRFCDSNGWIVRRPATQHLFGKLGGDTSYGTYNMFVYKLNPANDSVTEYNHSTKQGDFNVPIYFATYPGEINTNSIPSNVNFGAQLAYLNIRQGNNPNFYSHNVQVSQSDFEYRYKISNGDIYVEDHKIPFEYINELSNKGIIDKNSKSTARVSIATITTRNDLIPNRPGVTNIYKSGADAAWKFYNTRFSYKVFGFNSGDLYNPDKALRLGAYPEGSTANVFDNKLTFDPIPDQKRKLWVSHVDQYGNQLKGLKNNDIDLVNTKNNAKTKSMNLVKPNEEYERYEYQSDNTSYPKASNKNMYNGKKMVVTGYKIRIGNSYENADPNNFPLYRVTSIPPLIANAKGEGDYVRLKIYYYVAENDKPTEPEVRPEDPKPVEMVGRLCFINTGSFNNATNSNKLDYIPSTDTLTPYIKGAYPYIVRALRCETVTSGTSSTYASVTMREYYKYSVWKETHRYELTCKKQEHIHDSGCVADGKLVCGRVQHIHLGSTTTEGECYQRHKGCFYKETTPIEDVTRNFSYNVNYKHKYNHIANFKMFRIIKAEVYDNDENNGGTLFGGGNYTLSMSSNYNNRFEQGYINRSISNRFTAYTWDYNNGTVTSYLKKPKHNSGDVDSSKEAREKANNELYRISYDRAAYNAGLRVSFVYNNDYIKLDGKEDLVDKNLTQITRNVCDIPGFYGYRDIGVLDSSTSRYTSNLMSYMRPTQKLTDLNDFVQVSQTVPEHRVNGMRDLKGKIYYELANGGYNVGGNNFTATNTTYMDSPINVSNAYFVQQTADFTEPATGEYISNSGSVEGNKRLTVNRVNVFTPVSIRQPTLRTEEHVNHTDINGNEILQKNAEFVFTPTSARTSEGGYNIDTTKYIRGYYVKANFDITNCQIYDGKDATGNKLNGPSEISAGQYIYIDSNRGSIKAKTTENFGSAATDMYKNKIEVYAIAINTYDLLKGELESNIVSGRKNFIDYNFNKTTNTTSSRQIDYFPRRDIVSDAYHMSTVTYITKNVGRIFDFKITDCTDLAYKNVFRKNENESINTPTGNVYTGGIRKWDMYNSNVNELVPVESVGNNPKKIIPLGPYKNTNISYVNAPKLRI